VTHRINSRSYIRIDNGANIDAFRRNFVGKRTGLVWGFIENPFNRDRDFSQGSEPNIFWHLGNIPEDKVSRINHLIGEGNWQYV
jgi:hypothetical protein